MRYKHTCRVYDNKLLIIGGTNYKTTLKDFWQIELDTLASVKIKGSEVGFIGKYTQSSELYKNDVFILGETPSQNAVASLWKFSLKNYK